MEDFKSEKVSKYRGLGGFSGFGRIWEKMDGVGGLKVGAFLKTRKIRQKSPASKLWVSPAVAFSAFLLVGLSGGGGWVKGRNFEEGRK